MPKKPLYSRDLPRRMYIFFSSYNENDSAPSFEKFAAHIGTTAEDLNAFRSHSAFDKAFRVCQGLRRDYLIDRALTKRFDASFVKFLLTEDNAANTSKDEGMLDVTVKVIS